MFTQEQRDQFFRAYVEAALWSSTTGDGTPLDQTDEVMRFHQQVDALHSDTVKKMREDCDNFIAAYTDDLELAFTLYTITGNWTTAEQAGHDFWLTRNGHGAGFWDRGIGDVGERLTRAAHAEGGSDLLIGDDGLIHEMGA
jgi:hypothetical protein